LSGRGPEGELYVALGSVGRLGGACRRHHFFDASARAAPFATKLSAVTGANIDIL